MMTDEIIVRTGVCLKRSKSGRGLNIPLTDGGVLSVSLDSAKRIIAGEVEEIWFTKYPGAHNNDKEVQ